MQSRKHDGHRGGHLSKASYTAHRRAELASISKDWRESLLGSKRKRLDACSEGKPCVLEEDWQKALETGANDLAWSFKQTGTSLAQATRKLRHIVSSVQEFPDTTHLKKAVIPNLVKVLLMRRDDADAAEAVLEAAWTITNLAAGEHEIVEAVMVSAPALIAHLSGWLGLPVAEQCAWALGNMAGEDTAFCKTLAANGTMLPLARLMLRATSHHEGRAAESAGATAAWALSNLLWGDPFQANSLMNVQQLSKGLVSLLQEEHDEWIHTEAAWLLAFLCAGPETHMHTMLKHGAAEAVVKRMCSALTKGVDNEECLSLLTPLLRCMGNMGTSKAASQSLLTAACVAAVQRCAECSHASLQAESQWVMAMLSAMAKRTGDVAS